jgi:hypothetical protein
MIKGLPLKTNKILQRVLGSVCLILFCSSLLAANEPVFVSTTNQDNLIAISAHFTLPLTQCEAYRYLTDNTSQTALPGIVYAKATRLASNKVQIDRRVKEYVLFIPIHLDSLIEVTELPFNGTDFVQISGSAKSYKGSWRLVPNESGTKFVFSGTTDPGTMMPGFLVEHYINKNLRANFEEIARVGITRKGLAIDECRI